MGELVFQLRHLRVSLRIGRPIAFSDGSPTAVQVLLDIRPAVDNPHAPPLDLRFVIDRSGSMGGAKIRAVKEALRKVVETLTDQDILTITSFASDFSVDLPATSMSRAGRDAAIAAIDELKASGDTHISEALLANVRPAPQSGYETRVLLFTDGESTRRVDEDHRRLVRTADEMRRIELPLLVYGTGSGYNFALLQQLAVQAGNGSQLRHVMEADVLESELLVEIGFMRGVGVRGLTVEGSSEALFDTEIRHVTRFMPQQAEVRHGEREFSDRSGAVDKARGQQYLIELLVRRPMDSGTSKVFTARLRGKTVSGDPFDEQVNAIVRFTGDASEQPPVDPEIVRVLTMMAAVTQAEQGNFDAASTLYTRAGDQRTATVMADLGRRATRDREAARRGATTEGRTSVSVAHTVDLRDQEDD